MAEIHRYDAVIIGGGGAGLMGAVQLAGKCNLAVLSKLYPIRSHTGTAQGGIGAALGNMEEDHPEWHTFDTVKGGDYLVDQDAAEMMCREAVETVYDLEHMGLPFSRTEEGRIAQRRFGGHTKEFGKAPVRRSCYAADRTGHMILQTLYQQCIKQQVHFFDEFQVVDVLLENGRAVGVVAIQAATGELHLFHAKALLFASGGCGRIYQITSNGHALTGDGMAICLRRGIPLEDMEFFQFHPTGIYKMGILITEGARGEGGILRNRKGERFMQRYSPTLLDLAPRDIISRAMYLEARNGLGIDGKNYFHLDLTHLDRKILEEKLPDVTDFVRTYLGIDPVKEPIPVQPTAHYPMGGIPTDMDGRVLCDEKNTVVPGMYAAGEVACVSVHGANRLGTNSLVDILVFGRRAGRDMLKLVNAADWPPLPPEPDGFARQQIEALRTASGKESAAAIRETLQNDMMDKASVFRDATQLKAMQAKLAELRERYRQVRVRDRGSVFNTELLETLELGYLIDLAETIVVGAVARDESRGAHYREDFPQRDDAQWLKHTLFYQTDKGPRLTYKPVVITKYQPQERKY